MLHWFNVTLLNVVLFTVRTINAALWKCSTIYVSVFITVPLIDVILFSCGTNQCCTILMFDYVMLHYFDVELFDVALFNGTRFDVAQY